MGLSDKPEFTSASKFQPVETALEKVTQDLRALQQDVVSELRQDIQQLQAERSRLRHEIDRLRDQRQMLQSQQQDLLTQHQLAQQQAWAKQLAKVMATHLYAVLSQRMQQDPSQPALSGSYQGTTYQSLSALDTTLQQTLQSLRQDLNSYQSNLSQQLNRMQTLEQQGEAILEALVSRLSHQLQQEMTKPSPPAQPTVGLGNVPTHENGGRSAPQPYPLPQPISPATAHQNGSVQPHLPNGGESRTAKPTPTAGSALEFMAIGSALTLGFIALIFFFAWVVAQFGGTPQRLGLPILGLVGLAIAAIFFYTRSSQSRGVNASSVLSTAPAIAPEPTIMPVRFSLRSLGLSQFQIGFVMILLSTIALSLHNVVVRIIANPSNVFNAWEVGGYIQLNTIGNSLLILWMRMLIVVPLMAILAGFLYPTAWKDIKAFCLSKDRALLVTVVGSGFFLFLSQVLIYISIAQVGPAVAVTILFMYPLVTIPLAWLLFSDRPTSLRFAVMLGILLGIICTAYPRLTTAVAASSGNVSLGVVSALISGVAFAFYLISMQISFRKLHPVPVSLIQFAAIFVLTSLSLALFGAEQGLLGLRLNVNVLPESRLGLITSGVILGGLTLAGYLLNNFGVRFMGAAMASIVASSGPVLTALLAFWVIPSDQTRLQPIQILGILIVTLGVSALSFERLLMQRRMVRSSKPA
ncbi:MAG: EamA family transporter [Leptolyngbyaceae cyanobacterium SL_7_1]|nr:EamA family transporter [Leptolyngbyaceae cyanobacterium SL_7_1]